MLYIYTEKKPRKNPHQLQQVALESEGHKLSHLVDLDHFAHVRGTNSRARLKCRVCKGNTGFFCLNCTPNIEDFKTIYAVCNVSTGRSCFLEHYPNQIVAQQNQNQITQMPPQIMTQIQQHPHMHVHHQQQHQQQQHQVIQQQQQQQHQQQGGSR